MPLDAVKNFVKVTVSLGYAAGVTSIVLSTGEGAKLPAPATDGAFNLVWWNFTDYGDPADDPNVEIVRCTARTTDTLTIVRAQEGTADVAHNTGGKTYKIILSPTDKMIDDINNHVFLTDCTKHNEVITYTVPFENHAVLIKPFTHPVWTTVFDAFICDQFIASQPNARADEGSPDVAHSGAAGAVPGISRPTLSVWDYITFPQAMIAAANKGKGWHLMTAVEWAILAEWSRINGTMPHGGNANTDPPADVTYTSEVAQLDEHLHGENAAYHRALPGTGSNTWSHNHKVDGVWDLQGLVWQWVMGLAGKDRAGTEWSVSGQPSVLATTKLKYKTSAFGRGTISGSGGATPTLTCDNTGVNWLKAWTADEFNGMYIYIAEAASGAGAWYTITDTTATTIILTNADAPGNGTATFYIAKVIAHDITNGMTSANKILTLEDADADLKPFGIPATSDGTGSDTYGKDGYWFNKAGERAAVRGGGFSGVAGAGVFALYLSNSPDYSSYNVGFRACKCL